MIERMSSLIMVALVTSGAETFTSCLLLTR